MAESPRILSTLQRIAETARRINLNSRPACTKPSAPTILKSLPEHKPLLPLLLSYGIPSKLAQTCADRYDKYANQLRSEAEIKFAPYLLKRQSHAAGVYSLFLDSYSQALRRWAQSILNAALKSLKRSSVELGNLDVTHPKPLWLPSPLDHYPAFKPKESEKQTPLSSVPTPPHAFPTTYPPSLRPSVEIPSVEWRRTPRTTLNSPSTPTLDIDSLCLQFSKSLVIEENPIPSLTRKASMFSLPVTPKGELDIVDSSAKPSRRTPSQRHRKPPTIKSIPITASPRTVKPRQLSVPPSSTLNHRSTPRRASASAVISPQIPVPSVFSSPHRHTTPMVPSSTSLTTILASDLDTNPNFSPTTHSVCPQLSFDSPLDSVTCIAWNPPYPPSAPTTPPTVAPDLFSEPVVVSPIPNQLFSEPFPTHIADPFTQFQLQYNYLLGAPLISPDHSASLLGLVAGDLYPKGAFDTPLGSDYIPGEVF